MSFKIIQNSIDTIPHVVRLVLLGLLVLFISLFFPTNLKFDYDFEQGKRWKYADLTAPFDFPIKKTEGEIAEERANIASQMNPYYRWNKDISEERQKKFISEFEQKLSQHRIENSNQYIDSLVYLRFGLNLLKHIYAKKLIELKEIHNERGDRLVFELLDGNVDLGEYSIKEVFTNKAAMQFLVDTLSIAEKKLPKTKFLLEILGTIVETPNITYDSLVTVRSLEDAFKAISPYRGMVKAGEPIVASDRLIDSTTYFKLVSYKAKYNQEINQNKNNFLIYLAYLALTIALISIYSFFIKVYAPYVFNNLRHLSLIMLMIAGYSYLAYAIQNAHLDLYLIPFCIIPIVLFNFFNAQLALFTHIVTILLVSMLLSLDYQFILIQIVVGMVVIVSKLKTRHLSDFFVSLLYIGIAYTIGFLSFETIHTGTIFPIIADNGTVIEEGMRWHKFGWVLFNVFLTLLSYPLVPLFEKLFGLTSDITLAELADLDNFLLKELSIKAPGTLQHSLQVANLSEAAAKSIGANALLVKVAALYHDIGKMENPHYFIENQVHHENPHTKLTCLESAQMIIGHVTNGVKMAKKHHLPQVLIDFILTHHGTTRVEYFYRTYQKENPELQVNPTDFTYPGPKPKTKEQAIMMMADSLEAASKSLKFPKEEDIDNLVENIIQGKITMGQLQNTDLSFKELESVKAVFKQLLKSINHVRVEYPDEQKTKKTPLA